MDTILSLHRFQSVAKLGQVPDRSLSDIAKQSQLLVNVLSDVSNAAPKRILLSLSQFGGDVKCLSRVLSEPQDTGMCPLKRMGHVTVEQVGASLECTSFQNADDDITVGKDLVANENNGVHFGFNESLQPVDVYLGYCLTSIPEVLKRWINHPLHAQTVDSDLQRYKFTMAVVASRVGNTHLPNGVPSRNYGSAAADERLKIENEVSPTVTADLIFHASRFAKEERRQYRDANDNPKQNNKMLLVVFGHFFPLRPITLANRSHFFRQIKSAFHFFRTQVLEGEKA